MGRFTPSLPASATCPELEEHADGSERECGAFLSYQPGEPATRWEPGVGASVWCETCGWEADDVSQWLDDGSDAAYDEMRDERDR